MLKLVIATCIIHVYFPSRFKHFLVEYILYDHQYAFIASIALNMSK